MVTIYVMTCPYTLKKNEKKEIILPILFLSIAFTQTKRNFTNPYHSSQFETLIADAADAAIVPMSSKHIFMNRTNTIRYLHNAELA